ncbi:hypothetical protein [Qipengyuania nanhaisediminis]|uniref:hypothetical protein n=1 Tax=Qipengyuania nanhaisediminis TaxID=604088 RepID=UPI0038B2E3C2
MFGADTPLVFEALQLAGLAAAIGACAVWCVARHRKGQGNASGRAGLEEANLESRVRVLERIATDRSIDLADEIESLRDPAPAGASKGAGQ